MADMSPFRYRSGDSLLHRLHPLAKFYCLVAFSSGLMRTGYALSAPLLALGLVCMGILRITPREIMQKGRFLVLLSLFILFFRCFSFDFKAPLAPGSLLPALLYVGKLAIIFLLTELFFVSTRIGELGAAFSIASRACLRRQDLDPGLYLSLAVNFIPRVFAAYQGGMDAARSRAFGKRGYRYHGLVIVLTALLRSTIKSALWTAQAMEARGYRSDRSLDCPKAGLSDLLIALLATAYAVACFLA
jgi:energy-coupling factor transporter transmembrane protein EcfT